MANNGWFKKGHKLAPGGRRPGAGGKPKAVRDAIEHLRETLKTEIGKREQRLVDAYLYFAEADEATARHLIDKALPAAKTEIELSGGLRIVKVDAFDPDGEEKKRA